MTLPTIDSTVTYPLGSTTSDSTVLHRETLDDGREVVLLDTTACHPVDFAWPDQPSDRAVIAHDGRETTVLDCVVAASDGARLFVGRDVPVKKGTEGWAFVAAHIVGPGSGLTEGARVEVNVDAEYRRNLSAGHSACHLASLALNEQLAPSWRKDVSTDAAGSPNFDAYAIESSTIIENGSVDVYRIGKSLRKRGFSPELLVDQRESIESAINTRLGEWVASGAPIHIESDGQLLTGRREWHCALPGGEVSIPCGGTHLTSLAEVSSVRVALNLEEADGALILQMNTTASR